MSISMDGSQLHLGLDGAIPPPPAPRPPFVGDKSNDTDHPKPPLPFNQDKNDTGSKLVFKEHVGAGTACSRQILDGTGSSSEAIAGLAHLSHSDSAGDWLHGDDEKLLLETSGVDAEPRCSADVHPATLQLCGRAESGP